MFLSPHKSDNSQPTKQLSHSKSHNKQLLQKMMSDLQQQVQDCVREVFHLTSLSLQQTKYQITFYQQIASRLVNVTVELQSALGEVNNVIEKVDTINKSNNKDKSNQSNQSNNKDKSNKSNKREKKLQSVEHKGSPTSITEFNIDKDNTFNIDKDNTNNDSPTKLTIVVDDSINRSNSKVQLISPFKKEQDKQSPLKEQDNRKQLQLQKTVNNPQMSIPTREQQQSSSNQQSNSNKNNNQFQLSLTNDNLYKQYQQLLYTYHHDRHSLNHQNQILLNQWLQTHTHNLSSMSINTSNNTINNNNNTINNNNSNNNNNNINSNNTIINSNSNNNFYTIARTLIQQLSKYQSVSEHIHNIQSIEHNKLINQLKSTNNLYADNNDQQKKWIKHVTKSYLLNMAQLMHSHLSENQQIMQIYQQLNNYQHQQQQHLDHMR